MKKGLIFLNKTIATAVFVSLIIFSCSSDDTPVAKYTETVIPQDINDLFVGKGNSAKDTVFVYAEGGPVPKLIATDIEEPQFQDYYRVYVKQAQQINPTILNNEITFEQAIIEDDISTTMFQRVLQHFKDQDKKVVAMSHSFGSFIIPNVLDKHPNIADKVVIMAGRLNIPEVVWQGFRDGSGYTFENGETLVPDEGGDLSEGRLQAGLGMNRYTELLEDDDLSNVIYVHGLFDEAVGRLNQEEMDFLRDKRVPLIEIDGDHSSMFAPNALDFIVDFIRQE
ncbi:hypothetical protein VOI54_04140 [Tamlana sp. 2201CG12-4]|uniref:hypothetical protein n=1 Tax=Tamlana sp. 2201CG12-4 TaxID=3112582 RepID=UPI002DBB2364|nr:hypothetical protein [Tamlana sp. 2201CG12-4]MEC3906194.1 hypothetical protein [Tamlana sp. 2201CG12-4]